MFEPPKQSYYWLPVNEQKTVQKVLEKAGYTEEQALQLFKCARIYLVSLDKKWYQLKENELYMSVKEGEFICIPKCLQEYCQGKIDGIAGETQILIDGDEIFREMFRAAICARDYIYMICWSLDPDLDIPLVDGNHITLSELIQKILRENPHLKIYVLWSQISKNYVDWGTPEKIREFAVKLFGNTFLNQRGKVLIGRRDPKSISSSIQGEILNALLTLGTIHSKIFVVDGKVAFCGSANLHGWSRSPEYSHEVAVRLLGFGAQLLNNEFVGMWNRELKKEPNFSNGLSNASDVLTTIELNWRRLLESSISVMRSEPELEEAKILDTYLQLIHNAKKEIYIENQYFRHRFLASKLKEWILEDQSRKLRILITYTPEEVKDKETLTFVDQLTYSATIRSLNYLTEKIGEKTIKPIKNVEIFSPVERKPNIHSKLMITDPNTDDAVLFLGSANLNPRGLDGLVDNDLNILIRDPAIANMAYQRLMSKYGQMNVQPHDLNQYIEIEKNIWEIVNFHYELIEFLA
jgi:phosphatidylserine/phosphatidylglycerophosphate/cardiolipin synthase-like enzyme